MGIHAQTPSMVATEGSVVFSSCNGGTSEIPNDEFRCPFQTHIPPTEKTPSGVFFAGLRYARAGANRSRQNSSVRFRSK